MRNLLDIIELIEEKVGSRSFSYYSFCDNIKAKKFVRKVRPMVPKIYVVKIYSRGKVQVESTSLSDDQIKEIDVIARNLGLKDKSDKRLRT